MKYLSWGCLFLLSVCVLDGGASLVRPSLTPLPLHSTKRGQRTESIVPTPMNVTSTTMAPPRSQWYRKFFDVSPREMPKFLSLSLLMFWIVFIFTMTRDTKDTLIVTNCGAEAIAFLKVYGVLPAAALFMMLYAKMANRLHPQTLFYATLAPFIAFYAAFGFILYPLRHVLHAIPLPPALTQSPGLAFVSKILHYWTFSLYYIISDLWGSAGIPLLFWSCANDVVSIDQAKRIYPLLSLLGNLAPIFSGFVMSSVAKYTSSRFSNAEDAFARSLALLTTIMTAAGGLVAALYYKTHQLHAAEETSIFRTSDEGEVLPANTTTPSQAVAAKPKASLLDSLRLLAKDQYMRQIAVMVLSYGLAIEFTEIIWKASVKQLFPVKSDYMVFMGQYSSLVGVAAFAMMLLGSRLVKHIGWTAGALATPLMMGLTALPFYSTLLSSANAKTLKFTVYIGLVQNVLSKATKYALFDPTKEMTYIPLDKDSKTKGKAAIDVLGARLGKSGGALAQQLLVIFMGNILAGAPVVTACFYAVIFAWIASVRKLAPMFREKTSEKVHDSRVSNSEDDKIKLA